MANDGENLPILLDPPRLWLLVLRVAVGVSTIELLLFLAYLPGLLILLLFSLIYAGVFVALFFEKRSGAAKIARALSFFLFPASAVYLVLFLFDPSTRGAAPAIWLTLMALTQLTVVVGASQVSQPPKGTTAPAWHAMAERIFAIGIIVVVFIFIAMLVLPGGITSPSDAAAAWAQGGLWRIFQCSMGYYQDHSTDGFPPTLDPLGPEGLGCIPDEIINADASDSYNFLYTPGPPDAQGIVSSFTAVARPTGAVLNTPERFFVDQTGVLRFTTENRDPAAGDPTVY